MTITAYARSFVVVDVETSNPEPTTTIEVDTVSFNDQAIIANRA